MNANIESALVGLLSGLMLALIFLFLRWVNIAYKRACFENELEAYLRLRGVEVVQSEWMGRDRLDYHARWARNGKTVEIHVPSVLRFTLEDVPELAEELLQDAPIVDEEVIPA